MNPRTTALVLIEYQTTPGGKLHEAVKPVMESTHMLENTVEMVNEARKAGATIVYVPITFAADFREISPTPYGVVKGLRDGQVFQKGTWGAEIVDELKPQPKDIVIEGKRGLDGFASTNLDFILRSRKIDTIALSGSFLPIAALNQRCGPDTNLGTTSSPSRIVPLRLVKKLTREPSNTIFRCSRSR